MQARKRALAEGAIDTLRGKFGNKAVETGYTFGRGNRGRPEVVEDEEEDPGIRPAGGDRLSGATMS